MVVVALFVVLGVCAALVWAAHRWPDALRGLILRRIPITGLGVLAFCAATPWLGLSFVTNLLTIESGFGLLTVSIASGATGFAVGFTFLLLHLHGAERFGSERDHHDATPPIHPRPDDRWYDLQALLTAAAAAAVVGVAVHRSVLEGTELLRVPPGQWWALGAGIGGGLILFVVELALLLGCGAHAIAGVARLRDDDPTDPQDAAGPLAQGPSRSMAKALVSRPPVAAPPLIQAAQQAAQQAASAMLPDSEGYRFHGELYATHTVALFASASVVAVNLTPALTAGPWSCLPITVPAATIVLSALAAAVLVGGGVAFYVDPSRVPLFLLVGVAMWVVDKATPGAPTYGPGEPLTTTPSDWQPPQDIPWFVVAAEGGGIQAAGWTTRAIAGIDQSHPQALDRWVLGSGASGGAVGLVFATEARRAQCMGHENPDPHDSPFFRAHHQTTLSSLDAAAWSLVYQDIPGLGRHTNRDRGRALEAAWAPRIGRIHTRSVPTSVRLSDWAAGCPDGTRLPLTIANASSTEGGGPVLFASQRLGLDADPTRTGLSPDHPVEFLARAGHQDLDVVTIARVSAAFPYASPYARLAGDPEAPTPLDCSRTDTEEAVGDQALCTHLGDGGIYDNQGLATLVDVLRHHRPAQGGPPVRLLLLSGFASREVSSRDLHGGAFSAFTDPIKGLNSTRTAGQIRRNRLALEMMDAQEIVRGTDGNPDVPFEWMTARFDLAAAVDAHRRDGDPPGDAGTEAARCRFATEMQPAFDRAHGKPPTDVGCPCGEDGPPCPSADPQASSDGAPEPSCLDWLRQHSGAEPLTWRLSPCEKAAIDAVWTTHVGPEVDAWIATWPEGVPSLAPPTKDTD